MQDENTQTQPETPAPTATGPSLAELQARMAELERQSEGRLRDLQAERQKRQELEQRISSPVPPTVNPAKDELGDVLSPYIAPVAKIAQETKAELDQLRLEKAQNYLSKKMDKEWSQLENDANFQERLNQVVRKYGITGNVYDISVRAYELMELENLRNQKVEQERTAQAAASASIPAGMPPAPVSSSKQFSAAEFNNMSPAMFDQMSRSGDFRKNPDGSFTLVPR